METIIDVKSIVDIKKEEIKHKVKELSKKKIYPKLAVILANNEDSSKVYIGKKRKMCEELGIEDVEYIFDEKVTMEELLVLIERLNQDNTVDGILVQLPIFKHLDEKKVLNAISPLKDVDGFHPQNLGKLVGNQKDGIIPCTPKGIMMIIDALNDIEIEGKNAVVIGRSIIVGKPMAELLLNRNATVTICHSKTADLKSYTKNADILVVATGVAGLITKSMVKKDAIVIDVGINRVEGKLCGDVKTKEVATRVKYITPVPGGVGLTTVVSLMDNVVKIASRKVIDKKK